MSNFGHRALVPTRPVLGAPAPVAQHAGLVSPAGPRPYRPAVEAAAPGVGLQGGRPAAESSDGVEVVYMSPSAAALSSSAAQGSLLEALLHEPVPVSRRAHSVVTSYIESQLSAVAAPPTSAVQHVPAVQPAQAPPVYPGEHTDKPTAVVSPYESLPSVADATGAVLARPGSDSGAASPVPRPPALSAAPWWDPAYRPGTLTRLSARGAAVTRQTQPQRLSGAQLGELVDRSRLMVGPYELVARDSRGNMISTQQLLREASINAASGDGVWTEAEAGPSSLQKSMDNQQECSPCDDEPRELELCEQEPRSETYVQCEPIVKAEPQYSALKLEPPTIIDAGVDYTVMAEQASQSPQVKQEYLSPTKVGASANTSSFQSSAARLNTFIKQEPGVSSLQVSTVLGGPLKPEPAISPAPSPADSPEPPADSESDQDQDSDPERLPPGISLVNLHSLLNSEPGQVAVAAAGDTATAAEAGATADARPPSQQRIAGKARRKHNWGGRKKGGRKKIYRKPEGKGDGEIEPGNMVEVLFPNEDEPGESYDALDAKVMKVDTAVRPTQYYVHFQDMPHRCDRWVVRTDISRIYRTQLQPIGTEEPIESPWPSVPEAGTTPVNAASRDQTVLPTTLPRAPPPSAVPRREGAPRSATSRHEKAPQTAPPHEGSPETPASSKGASEAPVPRRGTRKASAPKQRPGTAVSRKGTPEIAVPPKGTPEIAVPGKGTPENVAARKLASDTVETHKGVPGTVETRKGAPGTFGTRKGAPETAATRKGTPGTAATHKGAPESVATRKGATAAAAPGNGPLETASVGAPQPVALRRKAAARREAVPPSAAARRDAVPPSAAARRDAVPPSAAARREAVPPSAAARRDAVPPSAAARRDAVPPSAAARREAVPPSAAARREAVPPSAAARRDAVPPSAAARRDAVPPSAAARREAVPPSSAERVPPSAAARRDAVLPSAAERVPPSAAARRESARPDAKRRSAATSRSPPPPSKRRATSPAARSTERDGGRPDTPPPVLTPEVAPPPRKKSYKPGPGRRKPGPKSTQRPVQPPRWDASDNAPGEGRVVHVIYETTCDGAKMLCPAKVMRVDTALSYRRYLVRYLGWQRRFCEWVTDSVLHGLVNKPAPAGTGQLLRRCVLPPPGRSGGAAAAVYTRLRPCSVDLSRANIFFLQVHRPLPHVVRDARVTALKSQLRPRMKDEYGSLTRW